MFQIRKRLGTFEIEDAPAMFSTGNIRWGPWETVGTPLSTKEATDKMLAGMVSDSQRLGWNLDTPSIIPGTVRLHQGDGVTSVAWELEVSIQEVPASKPAVPWKSRIIDHLLLH